MNPLRSITRAYARASRRNYDLARLELARRYLSRKLHRQAPVLIFQMGKVGSSTIVRSLAESELKGPVFHVHTLTEAGRRYDLGVIGKSARAYFPRGKHLLESAYLEREIRRGLPQGARWKLISLVRDPLAQHVSSFFQILDMLWPDYRERFEAGSLGPADLLPRFLEEYPPDNYYLDWFDTEMKPSFGIDVYAEPFPVERGYRRFENEHAELLLLRLESLDAGGAEAIAGFLGLEGLELQRQNEAHSKAYNALYAAFRQLQLPADYVEAIYGSRLARHFYSAAELARFRARWQRPKGMADADTLSRTGTA
jgi:hypothetical protein